MYCDIFQTEAWEEFKLKTGWEKSFRFDEILILQKRLPMGRTMLYAPLVDKDQLSIISDPHYAKATRGRQLSAFLEQIKKIAKENNSIFFRFELNAPLDAKSTMLNASFVKAFEEMQPEHNWVIDLTKSEEDILAGMKQKGRYNIKIATENNIAVSTASTPGPELDIFYKQYQATGKRHKVSFRTKPYFVSLLEILGAKGYASVCIAKHDNKPLTSAIFLSYQNECLYLYGASTDTDRNLMAPYLLHWQMIKNAREAGRKEYNLLGIAPNDDQNHPWAGITRFKKQFGGEQVNIAGSFDLIFKPLEYRAFKTAEKLRR